MKKMLKISLISLGSLLVTATLAGIILVIIGLKSLPNIEELVESYSPSVPATVYDANGEVIDLISKEMREEVDIEDLPIYVKDAFVAIEDRRFYKHPGIDPIRLGKATLVNIYERRTAQGGSTITQQLAKNAFLTNEKKFMRKVKEALIAIEIERKYDKDEILEKYINEIYFGSGFYGIQTASESFFGKDATELNLSESAMLAGIPNRPSYYNPRTNLENAVKRARLVLAQMKKQGLIDEKEYQEALNQKFVLEEDLPRDLRNSKGISVIKKRNDKKYLKTPDFMNIIEQKLSELLDEKIIYEGGIEVYTTLDLEMQKSALETFDEYGAFKKDPKLQGALITIDSSNGYVKSIVGGKNFENGNFNRAINAERQPGSAFKPFVYYTALEKGISMNSVWEDSEIKIGKWEPQNYGRTFIGNVTLLEAMEKSINTIAIKVLQDVGIKKVADNVRKTGAQMEIPNNLTTALGTMNTTPYDLAKAYIPMSNGGFRVKPTFLTKVTDREGHILYEAPTPKKERIFKSIDVSLLVYMMKDVVTNGSGKSAKVIDKSGTPIEQGGKTGTTNGFKSAWYAGITPEYVTTVYLGYDDNTSMPYGSSGGRLAAPLWKKYYQKMVDKGIYKPEKFDFIDENIESGDLVLVNMDSRTGFSGEPTEGVKRTGLFKKGHEPSEPPKKHFLKLRDFFSRDNEDKKDKKNEKDENLTLGFETVKEETPKETVKEMPEKVEVEKEIEKIEETTEKPRKTEVENVQITEETAKDIEIENSNITKETTGEVDQVDEIENIEEKLEI